MRGSAVTLISVVALAACSRVTTKTQGHDPPAVGEWTACADRSPVDRGVLCADFDEESPVFYENGVGTATPASPNREVKGPGLSEPNAIWFDGLATAVQAMSVEGIATASRVHAEATVWIDEYGTASPAVVRGALVRVGSGPGCYVEVALNDSDVQLQTHCETSYYDHKQMIPDQLPAKQWTRVMLDVDYGLGTATATLGAAAKTTLDLDPVAKNGGAPQIFFGDVLGARIAFDDILATAR